MGRYKPQIKKLDYYEEAGTPGGGDMLASVYDSAGGAEQVAFASDLGTAAAADTTDFAPALGIDDNYVTNAEKAALHPAITVTDSTEIDFTLTGQDITASIKSGSIDETKLDTSVNSSLDLADSAIQTELDPVFGASEAASFVAGDASKLAGIESGAEVNNISDVNATDLTDSGATTLHKHSYNNLDNLPSLVTTFTGLIDVPDSYTGQGGKVVAVKVAEDGVEFISAGGVGTVTSVAVSGSDGIEVDSGSPITSAGTIALGINKTNLLSHINVADGAEVNVQADWNQTTNTADDYIKNKPSIPTQYTDEMAQDAVGGMVDTSLTYTDGTPELKVSNPVSPQATGFTITAGTTPKTLTVSDTASVTGSNTGDQTLPTRDSLGLDTNDTVTFANLSGTNTGDNSANSSSEPSGAVSTHASLITGVHGVGVGTVAKTSDITATKLDDFTTPDDNTDLNANTTNHGLLLKATAPAAGLINLVGIANGETSYANKALFDATAPSTQAFGDAAATGSAVVSARRDHKHAMPAAPTNATTVTVADEASDTTCFPLYVTAATGDLGPKTNAHFTYDASTDILSAITTHSTTTLTDHIGEHTASHGIVFDNTITFPVQRQNNTTNTTVVGSRIETGWGVIVPGASGVAQETVTFATAFTDRPIVIMTYGGDANSSTTYGSGAIVVNIAVTAAHTITTSNFVARCQSTGGAWSAGNTVFYQWMAIGQ